MAMAEAFFVLDTGKFDVNLFCKQKITLEIMIDNSNNGQ